MAHGRAGSPRRSPSQSGSRRRHARSRSRGARGRSANQAAEGDRGADRAPRGAVLGAAATISDAASAADQRGLLERRLLAERALDAGVRRERADRRHDRAVHLRLLRRCGSRGGADRRRRDARDRSSLGARSMGAHRRGDRRDDRAPRDDATRSDRGGRPAPRRWWSRPTGARALRSVELLPPGEARLGRNLRMRSGTFTAGGLLFESACVPAPRERTRPTPSSR